MLAHYENPVSQGRHCIEPMTWSGGGVLEGMDQGVEMRFVKPTSWWALGGRVQSVIATSSARFSDGFRYPKVLRGRSLSGAAMRKRSLAL